MSRQRNAQPKGGPNRKRPTPNRRRPQRWLAGLSGLLILLGLVSLLYSCRQSGHVQHLPANLGHYYEPIDLPLIVGVRLSPLTSTKEVGVRGPYRLETVDKRRIESGRRMEPVALRVSGGRPLLGTQAMPAEGFRLLPEKDGTLRFGGRTYRGSLLVVPRSSGGFSAVNRVTLESYIRGLVGQEMSPSWPPEALKAQAVAARTYAFEHWVRLSERPHQLNEWSMAYRGLEAESVSTDRAVAETAGIIMVYNDRPFEAFFSSTCGGATSSIKFVHNQREVPPLAGGECGYCTKSPFYRWSYSASAAELTAALAPENVGAARSVEPAEIDSVGRAKHVEINGSERVSIPRFRRRVGYDNIKSAWFTVRRSGNSFIFQGRGWGHGVGMCQYGARAMAEQGHVWHRILLYYYPEMKLVSLK